MNKVQEVFKGSTSVVTNMAQQMADAFGAPKQATLDAAANLGLVAQGAGLSAESSGRDVGQANTAG